MARLAGSAPFSPARIRPCGGWVSATATRIWSTPSSETRRADFSCVDYRELLDRPGGNGLSSWLPTRNEEHVGPVLAAAEHGHALLIEKPLATDPLESSGCFVR